MAKKVKIGLLGAGRIGNCMEPMYRTLFRKRRSP